MSAYYFFVAYYKTISINVNFASGVAKSYNAYEWIG
jgi:hypothetical protein